MKHARKLASLLLALVMVFALATTAFAAQEGTLTGGSITINDAVSGQTYKAYQILYLESYNKDAGTYVYKANSAWETWLKSQTSYVSFDDQGYVTWVNGADPETFAKLAQAQIGSMRADASATAESNTVKLGWDSETNEGTLKLGYYLVDTSLGSLCSLDTTNPNVEMYEKNAVPTIGKEVQEDSDSGWGVKNDANIGQTVNFKTTVHAKKGAQNYVVHDKMSAGLAFNAVTAVKVDGTTLTGGTDYTVVTTGLDDDCDFHVVFTKTYLDDITKDTDIVIEYNATLNENAVISTGANTNDTKLSYGDSSSTEWAHTDTYTFMFDIIKTDSSLKVLDGAKFELYDAQTNGNKINLVLENGVYRVATATEANTEGFTSAVIEAGKATVKGLDGNTTYWLEETEAPAGYNKLAGRVEVKMENSNLTTTMTGDTWADVDGGVQITNNSGTELPSTGGIGTTIFYVLGSVLVIGAAVLLVTKKRMSANG